MRCRTTAAVIALFTSASPVSATSTWCAVVTPTRDGFVALRDGLGANDRQLMLLKPYDSLLMDTGKCWDGKCDETGRWLPVIGVPRIDGPLADAKSFTRGWVRATYVRQIVCPE